MKKILLFIIAILLLFTSCIQPIEKPEIKHNINDLKEEEYLLKITPLFNKMYQNYISLDTHDSTLLDEQLKDMDKMQQEFESIIYPEKYKKLSVCMKEVNLYWHNVSMELKDIKNGKMNFNPLLDNLYNANMTLECAKKIIGGCENE